MAYVEPEKDKEIGADGQPVATGPEGGGSTLGGDAAAGASGNAAAAAEAPASSGAPQGQFVGIKQYLDANKPQSQKLANNVGGYVGELGQNVRDSVGAQTGLYNKAVDDNTVNLNNDLFNEAKSNTVGVANDQAKLGEFQKERDAAYKGPTDFQSSEFYKPTDTALTKAKQAADNSQTEQGQRTLLNQYEQDKTGKTAGAGVTNFDQMLLQSGGGKEALTKARTSQNDLPGLINSANQSSLEKAKQAADTTAATKSAIQNEFGTGASSQQSIQNYLSQRVNDKVGEANTRTNTLRTALNNNQPLSDDDLKALGIGREDANALGESVNQIRQANPNESGFDFSGQANNPGALGLDLAQFVTPSDPRAGINAQNVANSNDYARYQALNQLMGTNNNFLNNSSMANTANTDAANLNLQGAKDYLAKILAERQKNGGK